MTTEAMPQEQGSTSSRIRNWRLWVAVGGVLLLLYTLLGFFLVPRIIRSQIVNGAREQLHREARVGDVSFNPFTLAATVAGVRLIDRDGVDLIAVDRIHVNADTFGIFRWALRFSEIRIEHPVVSARIMGDGKPSVADLMETAGSQGSRTTDEPFTLPRLIIDRLTMSTGVVQFSDASRRPTYTSRFEPLNIDVKDLITIPQEGGQHAVTIGVGDGAQFRWTGRQTVEPLQFNGRLEVTNVNLPRVWEYVGDAQPLDVREGRAEITLPYEIRRGKDAPFDVSLKGASARITALAVRPRDGSTDWLTVSDVRAEGVNVAWPASRAEVVRVAIDQPQVLARFEEDGRVNWQRAFDVSSSTPSSSAKPWTYRVGVVAIDKGGVRVEPFAQDASALEVTDLSVQVRNVTDNLAAPLAFTSQAKVQENGAIEAAGTVSPSPLALDVTFGARDISLTAIQPYMVRAAATHITTGTATLQGRASMSAGQAFSVAADGSLDDVELRESDERLAAWRKMAIEGVTFEDPPYRTRIRSLTVDGGYAKFLIDQQGNLNLTRLATPASPGAPAGGASADAATASKPPSLEIGVVTLRDATADFSDLSLPLSPFSAQIHSANGTIRDLSSFAAAPATVAIEGRVDKTGHVKVDGTLRTSDPMAASEIMVNFRSIEMVGLTPYVAQFAGYRVKSGVLDLDVRYLVQQRRLIGNHKVVAQDLVLGERVKDSKGPGFAVRLAVALLKDREGRINVEVPIEGTVDDPQFAYRQVFWNAVKTILGNAAKAPFRAIGRMFGRDEDDLELVEFDAGRSDLLPAEQEMLTKLGEQLVQRGDLSLEIEGRFDPKADPPAMKRAKLEQLIESRRAAATAAPAPGSSALETILAGLFTEQFSAEALQAERQRFTSPALSPTAAGSEGSSTPAPAATSAASAAPVPVGTTGSALSATPAGAPEAQAAPQAFDASGFYESLRQKLLEAQQVTDADLTALGTARAATITAVVTKVGAVDATRITNSAPSAVKRSKANSTRIASEMKLSGGDVDED